MTKAIDVDYAIEIDFLKNSKSPERVFFTLGELIKNFQTIDSYLIESIDSKIKPILLLEDIEAGSVRAWLKAALESIDDEALKNLEIKQVVGSYLVKGKYAIVNFLDGKSTVTDRQQLESLESELIEMARDTDILHIPSYQPIKRNKLLTGIQSISQSLKGLSKKDKAYYMTKDQTKKQFNVDFEMSPETIDDLFVKEKLEHKNTMIIKVKKPDYLGESMWEFRHDTKSFLAKVIDQRWLDRFQARKEDVRPGDSIKAEVIVQLNYGFDGELISEKYFVKEIFEVIPLPTYEQLEIYDDESKKSD